MEDEKQDLHFEFTEKLKATKQKHEIKLKKLLEEQEASRVKAKTMAKSVRAKS